MDKGNTNNVSQAKTTSTSDIQLIARAINSEVANNSKMNNLTALKQGKEG